MSRATASQLIITAPQLGQLLLSARKRRKLTQTAVAHRLGLSQNRISHLEQHPEEISVSSYSVGALSLGWSYV
jgi:HTH-type transcriptional regulator/antitoxin HipB